MGARAMTSRNLAHNSIVSSTYIKAPKKGIKVGELIDGNPVTKEEDSDGEIRILQLHGIRAIANAIKDMRAISSVNVLGNEIGIEQAQVLAAILKEHPTLKSLCGHKGDETELNMSGKEIGVEGAIMLAPEIVDNGALSQFIFSDDQNDKTVTMQTSMTKADFRGQGLGVSGAIIVAAFLPKCM
jgi:hypothetical protein